MINNRKYCFTIYLLSLLLKLLTFYLTISKNTFFISELLAKLDVIFSNTEIDNLSKVEELNKFYLDVVLDELKNTHR